jgi:hypothetical protein
MVFRFVLMGAGIARCRLFLFIFYRISRPKSQRKRIDTTTSNNFFKKLEHRWVCFIISRHLYIVRCLIALYRKMKRDDK